MKKRKKRKTKSSSSDFVDSFPELSDIAKIPDLFSVPDFKWPDVEWPDEEKLGPEGKRQRSAKEVARWMLRELKETGQLDQSHAADSIRRQFGGGFLYKNRNDNPAIATDVLEEFRKLTEKTVMWVRRERMWRLREEGDPPGRMVD